MYKINKFEFWASNEDINWMYDVEAWITLGEITDISIGGFYLHGSLDLEIKFDIGANSLLVQVYDKRNRQYLVTNCIPYENLELKGDKVQDFDGATMEPVSRRILEITDHGESVILRIETRI